MRHFRIAHLKESADEGQDIIVRVNDWEDWTCEPCGTLNGGDWGNCLYCNLKRGTYVCEECGHRNPHGAAECEECGREKAEE